MSVAKSGTTREAFTYALNQERYLRVFLEDGEIPKGTLVSPFTLALF